MSGATIRERIAARLAVTGEPALHGRRVSPSRPGNIYDWLNGRQKPDAETIPVLARELGMTVNELLGIAAGQEPPFAAWHEFLDVLERRGDKLDELHRQTLAAVPWPPKTQPTVASYEMMLAALRATMAPRDN